MTAIARAHPLDVLIRPRSVAIVGASADPQKTSGKPARFLRQHGYAGTIHLVNPRYTSIDGLPCYPTIDALPEAPDAALVLIAADEAINAVRQLSELGTGAAIVLAGGFAEIGGHGVQRQDDLRAAAGAMRLLGPNTLGLINVADHAPLTASVALELPDLTVGGLSIVSQSGGMLGALLSRGLDHGVGFSKLVATGNELDLDVCDILEYLLADNSTSVIALYLESVRRPERFRALAAQAETISKPLIALKVGRSAAGAMSASSHTGALAGTDRVYDALFAQLGVFRVTSLSDLIDVSNTLVRRKPLNGQRLAILTSTGGGATIVADAAGLRGFDVPPPDAETTARLQTVMTGEGAMADRNPVDVTLSGLTPDVYRATISALLESPSYDALVVVVGSSGIGQPELAARPILAAAETTPRPLLVYVNPRALNIVRHLNLHGVPAFDTPEGCAASLDALLRLSVRAAARVEAVPPAASPDRAHSLGAAGALDEAESKVLFARFGIRPVDEWVVATPEEAAARARAHGRPVVLKVLSRDIAHKTESGGVRVGVAPDAVAAACLALRDAVRQHHPEARLSGWLVQEQVESGIELILGMVRDPQLGPAILLGAGGIAAEVFEDVALRLPPLRPRDAADMLAQLKVRVVLGGFRNRPRADSEALIAAVLSFSQMVETIGDRLLEAEINPLFVLPAGQGVRAADGLVVLR